MKRKLLSLFKYGITMVFDNDGGGDANNANAGGGDAGDSKPAGGGSGGDSKPAGDTKPKVETHAVKIDGEDKILTTEELITLASKAGGADKKFQDAATATKAAERGLRIEELTKKLTDDDNPTEADIREYSGLIGIEPTEFMQFLSKEDPPQKGETEKTSDADFDAEFQKRLGHSPAEVKAILEFSTTRHVTDARKEIRGISDKAVDKDEIIGKMIVGKDKDDVTLAVKDMVAEDVLKKIQDGVPFGAEMVTASVQRVRSQLTKLGIPKKLNQHPFMGLGPSEGFSSAIQADEPIKRVPANEDTGEQNLVDRYLQKALQTARKMR